MINFVTKLLSCFDYNYTRQLKLSLGLFSGRTQAKLYLLIFFADYKSPFTM